MRNTQERGNSMCKGLGVGKEQDKRENQKEGKCDGVERARGIADRKR